jgi:cyclic pyranopterin phosphate synthase
MHTEQMNVFCMIFHNERNFIIINRDESGYLRGLVRRHGGRMKGLSHLTHTGEARMVDVSAKKSTKREAVATGSVFMKAETLKLISDRQIPKGDVFCVARTAGMMAAKKTAEIIPMCHPLSLTSLSVDFSLNMKMKRIDIEVRAKVFAKTGAEMEALVAVSAAALTIYDMCKSVDKDMLISEITLREKRGGKGGNYRRKT